MNKIYIPENKKNISADRFCDTQYIHFQNNKKRDKEDSSVKTSDYLFQGEWTAEVIPVSNIFTEDNNPVYSNEISSQGVKYNTGCITAIIFTSSISRGCIPAHEPSDARALFLSTPTAENVTMSVASANCDQPTLAMYVINGSRGVRCNKFVNGIMNFSKVIEVARILGLVALISYMIVILFTWIYANLEGKVYFLAGEPILFIKYSEWALGLVGILVGVDCLRKEI